MEKLWVEPKRRNVLRVATVYAMSAWIVIQVTVAVFPHLGLPSWLITAVIVLALVGFLIALIISWVYEWGPEGLVRTEDADDPGSPARPASKRSWGGTITIGVLAVLLVGQYFCFKHWKAEQAPMTATAESTRSHAIAVLPFVNRGSES